MAQYQVCLEIGEAGECLAHVPELPGCIVHASTQEEALAVLPDAIRTYHAWLQAHGESTDWTEPITLDILETSVGFGPFQRGDKAALFATDRVPVTRAEMQVYLARAEYSRADLMLLVHNLPAQVLNWKASEEAMSVRQILRHVGDAEEWYVSRLVAPETLPPEWDRDEDLPLFEFLEMERRTAVERLCRLTDEELAQVFNPQQWTEHPEEMWTARKALRRMIEHEREHCEHICNVLDQFSNPRETSGKAH